MIKTDLHPQGFGSQHDTVLAGVARGLPDLFPPIHNHQSLAGIDEPASDAEADERNDLAQDRA